MYTTPRTKAGRLELQAAEIARKVAEGADLSDFGSLKIVRWEGEARGIKRWYLNVYKGTASKPFARYYFKTSDKRSDYVKQLCEAESKHDDFLAASKASAN